MINSITINGFLRDLSLDDIPSISRESSMRTLEPLNTIIQPTLRQIAWDNVGVKNKINNLNECKQLLQEAKEHALRDKIYAMLRSALTVSLIAGIFIAPASLSMPLSMIYCTLSVFGIILLGDYYAERIQEIKNLHTHTIAVGPPLCNDPKYLLISLSLLGTAFLPFYEVFAKQFILEEKIEAKKDEISRSIARISQRFEQNASRIQRSINNNQDLEDFMIFYNFYNNF